MVSILDIGPASETVTIQGQPVLVRGVSALGIFTLLEAFPDLRKVWTGQALDAEILQSLISKIPFAIDYVIAAGLGHPAEDEYVKWSAQRSVGEQFELVTAILGLTFPKGVQSFMEAVEKQVQGLGGVSGKVLGMKSPEPSKPASAPDTTSATAGTTPPASSEPGASS